jgi:hypothetical protein
MADQVNRPEAQLFDQPEKIACRHHGGVVTLTRIDIGMVIAAAVRYYPVPLRQ